MCAIIQTDILDVDDCVEGMRLSGGQAKRLALAKTLWHKRLVAELTGLKGGHRRSGAWIRYILHAGDLFTGTVAAVVDCKGGGGRTENAFAG